ncbi:MAG: SMC-Scp complex subunit ScpB [Blastocatellales bacterium]
MNEEKLEMNEEELSAESLVEDQTGEETLIDESTAIDNEPEDEWPEELSFEDDLTLDEEEIVESAEGETIRIIASDETVLEFSDEQQPETSEDSAPTEEQITASREELKPAIESLLFVADEPLPFKQLCKVMGDVPEADVLAALQELATDYESRNSGLEVREIAGGWRISTRPQNHEFIRKYLKSRPSARLSLPALETLAVIAYKQPITIPEILEIRGVSSSSAIKTLLEKRLIVTKGRKETVGRPMMYGTSKEFLIQFGLKDLTELPSIEDFEDLAQ